MNKYYLKNTESILLEFKREKSFQLRQLSEVILKHAAIHEDKALVEEACVAYALHKLLTKTHYSNLDNWPAFKEKVTVVLEKSIEDLKEERVEEHLRDLHSIGREIEKIDKRHGSFLQSLMDKAHLKIGLGLYERGYSVGSAAELTDSAKLDLMKYVGNARVHENLKPEKSILVRVSDFEEALK